MRSIVPHHFGFRRKELIRRNQLRAKKINTLNDECEKALMKASNNLPCHLLTVNHFINRDLTKATLKDFVKVILTEDLSTLKENNLTNKKGKLEHMGNSYCLLDTSFNMKEKPIIAKRTSMPSLPTNESK